MRKIRGKNWGKQNWLLWFDVMYKQDDTGLAGLAVVKICKSSKLELVVY